jgi:hypothetical protein
MKSSSTALLNYVSGGSFGSGSSLLTVVLLTEVIRTLGLRVQGI